MITSPQAKHEELAYELLRWYNSATYTITQARLDATDVIEFMLAAIATSELNRQPVVHHPLTEWIANTFIVHWWIAGIGTSSTGPTGLDYVTSEGEIVTSGGEPVTA